MRKVNVSFQISYALISISIFLLVLNNLLLQTLPLYSLRNFVRILALFVAVASMFFYPDPIALSTPDILLLLLSIPGCVISRFQASNLLFVSLILICLKPYSIQAFIKICKNASVLTLLIYILLYRMGYIKWITHTWIRRRNTLGFSHPNAAMLFLFSAVMIWILDSPTMKRMIVGCVFIQWAFFQTDSRASYLSFLIFCFFVLLHRATFAFEKRRSRLSPPQKETGVFRRSKTAVYFKRSHQAAKPTKPVNGAQKNLFLFEWAIQIIALSLIFWPFFSYYVNQRFAFLNKLLSNRVTIAMATVSHLTPEQLLFGGIGEIDNVSMCLLLEYGIPMLLFFSYRTLYSLKNAIRHGRANRLALLVSLLALASVESSLIRPEILISLVFWKIILYNEYDSEGFAEDAERFPQTAPDSIKTAT